MTFLSFFFPFRVFVDGIFKFQFFGIQITYLLALLLVLYGMKYLFQSYEFAAAFLLVVCYLGLSTFLSLNHWGNGGLEEFTRTIGIVSVFAICKSAAINSKTSYFFLCVTASGFFSAILSIFQFISDSGMKIEGINRCPGFLAHPNSAALFYGSLIILNLRINFFAQSKFRNINLLALYLGLISTFSISGIFVTLFGVFILKSSSSRHLNRQLIRFPLLISFAILAFKFLPQFAERANSYVATNRFQSGGEANSLLWRIARWREIVKYWYDAPIFGQGYGASTNGAMLSGYLPHNEYLRVLVELGIFGTILFLAIFLIIFKLLNKSNVVDFAQSGRILCIMSLLSSFTENTFLYSVHGFLLAAVLGVSLRRNP